MHKSKKEKRVESDKKEEKIEKEKSEEKHEEKEKPEEKKEDKKEDNKIVLETSKKEEITISGNKDQSKEVKTTVTTTTTTISSTAPKEQEKEEKKEETKSQEEKEEKKEQPQQQNYSYFPMFMYPGQSGNTQMPMAMPMPMTSKEGDKTSPQQPFICMMPVCFCDPSKMPKDMKFPTGGNMPNVPFAYFPYPMAFPQNNPENK